MLFLPYSARARMLTPIRVLFEQNGCFAERVPDLLDQVEKGRMLRAPQPTF